MKRGLFIIIVVSLSCLCCVVEQQKLKYEVEQECQKIKFSKEQQELKIKFEQERERISERVRKEDEERERKNSPEYKRLLKIQKSLDDERESKRKDDTIKEAEMWHQKNIADSERIIRQKEQEKRYEEDREQEHQKEQEKQQKKNENAWMAKQQRAKHLEFVNQEIANLQRDSKEYDKQLSQLYKHRSILQESLTDVQIGARSTKTHKLVCAKIQKIEQKKNDADKKTLELQKTLRTNNP